MNTPDSTTRFSMKELMLVMTSAALVCGAFAVFNPAVGALFVLLAGAGLYWHGRRTGRSWMMYCGEFLIVPSVAVLLAIAAGSSPARSRGAMQILGGLWAPFVGQPQRMLVVAGVLLATAGYASLLRKRVTWEPAVVAVVWGLLAAWEEQCRARQYNIRIDLLIVSPVMMVLTLWAVIRMVRGVYRSWNGEE